MSGVLLPLSLMTSGWGWEEASSLAEAPLKMCPGSSSANQVAKNTTIAKAEMFAQKTEFSATSIPSTQMSKILTQEAPIWACPEAQVSSDHGVPLWAWAGMLCSEHAYSQGKPQVLANSLPCVVAFFSAYKDQLSLNPLHLWQERSVLDLRSFPLIHLLSSLLSNHLLFCPPGLLVNFLLLGAPCRIQSTHPHAQLPLRPGPSKAYFPSRLVVFFLQYL